MKLRIIPYLFSQYIWLIIFSIPLLSLITFSTKETTKDFFSNQDFPDFNFSAKPTWILHSTDIHINSFDMERYNNTYNSLLKALEILKPKKILLTGDLVDNKNPGTNPFRPYTEQKESDWELYERLLSELNLTNDPRLVQVAGNHDFYDILSFDSKKHYANGVLYNKSTFLHSRHSLDVDVGTASVLAINPFEFPAPSIRLTWFTSPSTNTLRKLKSVITESPDTIQIIAQHHPVAMLFPNSGITTDASYAEIIKQTTNVRLILTGHRHPPEPVFKHWGDALEVIGTPLFKYPNRFGLVTIDNMRVAYHDVDVSAQHIAVMTCPAPRSQTSRLDVFSNRNSEVRALFFGEKPGNLSITGNVTGQLDCSEQIEPNVWLCKREMNLTNGNYVIHKVGDWSGDVEFTVSSTISGFNENKYLTDATMAYTFLYAWITLITVVVTFPISVSGVGTSFEAWLHLKSDDPNWLYAIFAGFIAVRHRLCRLPFVIRIFAFIATVWPIVLPLSLFGIEDKPAMFWAWGYVGNGVSRTSYEGTMFGLYYLYLVVLSFVLINSAIEATDSRSFILLFDGIVYIAALCGTAYYTYTFCDWFGIVWALTSPAFSLFPIIFIVLTIWNFVRTLKDTTHTNRELFEHDLLNE